MEPENGACPLLAEGDIREITGTSRRVTFRVPTKFVYAARRNMHYEDGAGLETSEIVVILEEHWFLLFPLPNEAMMSQLPTRA